MTMSALAVPSIQDDSCDTFNDSLEQIIGEIACLSLVRILWAMPAKPLACIANGRIESKNMARLPMSPKMVWNPCRFRRLIGYSLAEAPSGK